MRVRTVSLAFALVATMLLAACTLPKGETPDSGGGYYGGDGPPVSIPVDPFSVPDAVPRAEMLSSTGNRPYTALGQTYYPLASARDFEERGKASWYGSKFQGKRTSSGEPYDMFAMTAAHPTLPLPSYVEVTNLDNGRQVVVKVNDRGPFLHDRIIDLSYAAAVRLGYADTGTGNVAIRTVFANGKPATESRIAGAVSVDRLPGAYIQVGAFSDVSNAEALRSRLLTGGFSPVEILTSESGRPLHRVRVGPFDSDVAADRDKSSLAEMLNTPVYIVFEP